jgi:hypothetical protein
MNCREFERACNELIDAEIPIPAVGPGAILPTHERSAATWTSQPDRPSTELQDRMRAHASGCPACREMAGRYEALRLALRAWGPPPAAPEGLADRILGAVQVPLQPLRRRAGAARIRRFWRVGLPLATAAASIIAAVTIGLLIPKPTVVEPRQNHRTPTTAPRPGGGHSASANRASSDGVALNEALAGASEATWNLARSASEPAARISQQFLDSATGPQPHPSVTVPAIESISVPSLGSLAPNSVAAVAMLQDVGDRLAIGVRPLSTTARHAFGFLLGPAAAKPEVRPNPPAAKGA